MYVFVCMRVCVYVCSSQSFCILSLARITKENKHCLYYSNEYGLGNKLYNFPLTHTHRMPRVAQGNLWHLTLLAPNTAVLHCCLTPDLWKLITATSLTTSLVAAPANRAPPIQQSLLNTRVDIITLISCKGWYKDTSAAAQKLFVPVQYTQTTLSQAHYCALPFTDTGNQRHSIR